MNTLGNAGLAGTASTNEANGVNGTGPDLRGAFKTEGYNLVGRSDAASFVPIAATDYIAAPGVAVNPSLGPLANNGGPTMTMALLPGSLAINVGDDTLVGTLDTDQRDYLRSSGGHVDIGAFEVQVADPANPPRISNINVGSGSSLTLSFTNNPGLQFQMLASTNVALPLNQWLRLGPATQLSPGQYQFTDSTATNYPAALLQSGLAVSSVFSHLTLFGLTNSRLWSNNPPTEQMVNRLGFETFPLPNR